MDVGCLCDGAGGVLTSCVSRCTILPRDQKRADMMRKEWADAQVNLDSDGNFTHEFLDGVFAGKSRKTR